MADIIYFDDNIKVHQFDPDGKKYDKVSRIVARSETLNMEVTLDLNTEIYPVNVKERYRMAITSSLHAENIFFGKDTYFLALFLFFGVFLFFGIEFFLGSKSLANKFEYVMHGLLYKMAEDVSESDTKVVVYVSFGGLQLMLKGKPTGLGKYKIDQRLYLLLRNV